MEVILGREQQSRRLNVSKDGKLQVTGMPNSVPMDVSRQHVLLRSKGDGKWEIKNLNDRNVTYVNGMAVESKVITESDKIELGESRYAISWEIIRGPKVEVVDIRHLNKVWDDYKTELDRIEERKKSIGLMSSIPMAISMAGGAVAVIAKEHGMPELGAVSGIFTGLAFLVLLYGLYMRKNDKSKEKIEELKKEMYKRYTCPKCGRFLGLMEYDLLIQQTESCPKCKSKFKI